MKHLRLLSQNDNMPYEKKIFFYQIFLEELKSKNAFTRISRYIWKCNAKRSEYENEDIMLEKCLSTIIHLDGIPKWNQGLFVDFFSNHNFFETSILEICMTNILKNR